MEPKMAFPPQMPSSSSAAAANPLSSPALSIEQQLMRGQLGGQLVRFMGEFEQIELKNKTKILFLEERDISCKFIRNYC